MKKTLFSSALSILLAAMLFGSSACRPSSVDTLSTDAQTTASPQMTVSAFCTTVEITDVTTPELPLNTTEVPVTATEPSLTTAVPPVDTSEAPVTTSPAPSPAEPLTSEAIAALEACGAKVYYGDSRIVAIDAGHQAKGMPEKEPNGPGSSEMKAMLTSGAAGISTRIPEYELNLAVALKLRDELIARGYTVVMIRETNEVTLSNAQRAQIANAAGAGAFVRIHANGSDNASVNGALTMCQTVNNRYNGGLYSQSRQLSELLLDAYAAETGLKKRDIIETDTITGINWANVPSTIIEMGFLSNAEEDERMAAESFKQSAAVGMANGLDAFFAE